ncbi:ribonuclease P protein component [Pseudokineococcus basanitobsidens]|uniref:Ribonuclease P protein component n=1 Tax=Pseudokineococcus basanitobsidens TaxID=1926649 RepID=A0ABU8RLB6_9ACTN
MLPAGRRVRTADAFRRAVRSGARSGRPALVVHLALTPLPQPAAAGFVVSRAVGGAVVRNRVRRRLQHLVAERLDALPRGAELVVRALPPAAGATSSALAADLDGALASAARATPGRRSGPSGRPRGSRPAGTGTA